MRDGRISSTWRMTSRIVSPSSRSDGCRMVCSLSGVEPELADELMDLQALEHPAMRRGGGAKLFFRFGQGDVKAVLPAGGAVKQELQGQCRLAGSGNAFQQVQSAARQTPSKDDVETFDARRNARRTGQRFVLGHQTCAVGPFLRNTLTPLHPLKFSLANVLGRSPSAPRFATTIPLCPVTSATLCHQDGGGIGMTELCGFRLRRHTAFSWSRNH